MEPAARGRGDRFTGTAYRIGLDPARARPGGAALGFSALPLTDDPTVVAIRRGRYERASSLPPHDGRISLFCCAWPRSTSLPRQCPGTPPPLLRPTRSRLRPVPAWRRGIRGLGR